MSPMPKIPLTDQSDDSAEVAYDNDTSGLTATTVQAAIDELAARVDALEAP